ncbi:MAG: BON domain-containing protein [Synechococcales bacterium]|nr:BON domain-containing protein [Synechococcales bacterium]
MKRTMTIVLGTAALMGLMACSGPSSTESLENTSPELNSEGDNQVRENQLESAERAQQDREEMFGNEEPSDLEAGPETGSLDAAESGDRELVDAIQAELDTQLPDNQLAVEANGGDVTIAGEVASEAEVQQIEAIASQIEGVRSVNMQTTVTSPST